MEEKSDLEKQPDVEEMSHVLDGVTDVSNEDKKGCVLIVKIIYRSHATATHGIILLFIDVHTSKIINKYIAFSHDEKFTESISISSNYSTIISAVENKLKDSILPASFISNIDTKLSEIFTKNIIQTLCLYQMPEYRIKVDEVVDSVGKIIVSTLGDESALPYIGFEKAYKDTLNFDEDAVKEAFKSSEDNKDSNNDDGLVKVKGSLVLSPVYGRPINEILENDTIMIRVDNTTEEGKNVNIMFKAINKNKEPSPIPVTVVKKMYKGKDGVVFVLKISDGIYSVITETEPVKIQLHEDIKSEKIKSEQKEHFINRIVFILGISVFVLSGLIIYFIINT